MRDLETLQQEVVHKSDLLIEAVNEILDEDYTAVKEETSRELIRLTDHDYYEIRGHVFKFYPEDANHFGLWIDNIKINGDDRKFNKLYTKILVCISKQENDANREDVNRQISVLEGVLNDLNKRG